MECILKIQGVGSSFVREQVKNVSSLDIDNYVIFFTGLAEFTVSSGTVLSIFDIERNTAIGKVKLLEVHMPYDRIWHTIEEGHRAVGVYELLDGMEISDLSSMEIFDRFDFVEDRFFLYLGDINKLYNKFYGWKSD